MTLLLTFLIPIIAFGLPTLFGSFWTGLAIDCFKNHKYTLFGFYLFMVIFEAACLIERVFEMD